MLSRVADSLYWMSRYLERAEHSARLIDVNLNLMLDYAPGTAESRWRRVMASLGVPVPTGMETDAHHLLHTITFDISSRMSIVSSIMAARENARQVREQISSEMWEQLNRLFHAVKRTTMDELWEHSPHEFLAAVKEGSHLFQGITDSTMTHGEGWHFIQVGPLSRDAPPPSPLCSTSTSATPSPLPISRITWSGSACSSPAPRSSPSAAPTRPTSNLSASRTSCC